MADDDVVIEHPNRKKATSKLTRLLVVILLLASAALVLIVTLGGWSALEGAKFVQFLFILVDVILAVFVWRWSRGVLPMGFLVQAYLTGVVIVLINSIRTLGAHRFVNDGREMTFVE